MKIYSISTTSLLGIAFIILKLVKQIDWSWWWVLSPFWIPWLFVLFLIVSAFIYGAIKAVFEFKKQHKKRK